MRKHLIFAGVLSTLLTFCSFSLANELSGHVTDRVTASVIAGAKVLLIKDGKATGYRTATDFEGNFSIVNILPGSYDVLIFHPNYAKKEIKNIEISADHGTSFSYRHLTMDPIHPLALSETGKPNTNEMYPPKPLNLPIQNCSAQRVFLDAYYIQLRLPLYQIPIMQKHLHLKFFRELKATLKYQYGLKFTQDSSLAKGLLTISPVRLANGRLKQVMATYVNKQTRGEISTLLNNVFQKNDYIFLRQTAEEISTLLKQIEAGLSRRIPEKAVVSRPPPETKDSDFDTWKYSGPKGQVKGQVLDKRTKEPTIGARVRLLLPDGTSAKMGAIADEKGNFVVLNLPPGCYQLEISYGPTFTKQFIKDVNVDADQIYNTGVLFLEEKKVIREDTSLYPKNLGRFPKKRID